MGWEADLDEARRRVSALDPERDLASALKAATSERLVAPYSESFLPLPPVARDIVSLYGGFTDDHRRAERLHLDAHGRPVALASRYAWFWSEDGHFVEIDLRHAHVRRYRREYLVSAGGYGEQELQRLTWHDAHAVRADGARGSVNGVRSFAATAHYAADGRLERVRRDWLRDDAGELGAALERSLSIEPERVIYDGRVSAPEPWPDDAEALVEPLAVALDRAIRDAIAAAPVEEPFVAAVSTRRDDVTVAFPPLVLVVEAAWRDRIRKRSKHDGAAIGDLNKSVEAGHGVVIDLVDRLDEDALRACRVFTTAFQPSATSTHRRSDTLADAVGERLAERLNGAPVAGTAEPFLALVSAGGLLTSPDARGRARRTAPHFERFMASVSSTRGKQTGRTTVEQALRDRGALEAYLREGGLPEHARRLARELARVGFRLDAGRGRSRLGGRPLLPPEEPWPADRDGHPLTFLAALDLSELPPSSLPGRGWMLFFADLGDGDMDTGFYGAAANRPGAEARLLFSEEPVEATGPETELGERHVVATPFLTLPDGFGAREVAELDVFEGTTYEELAHALARPTWDGSPHWVGGWVTGCQGHVDESGTLLLFHMAADDKLGFSYLDAGSLQFRIPPDALAERDWSRVLAEAESS